MNERHVRSAAHLAEADGCLTNWMPPLLADGPRYQRRAWGCRVEDVDGNVYLDYVLGFGSVLLGHDDPDVRAAIVDQLGRGAVGSLDHPLRIEVARQLLARFPAAERVAFFKSGSEATQVAVRLARLHTGRDEIVHHGYHGWYDWCSRNPGVPEAVQALVHTVPYNDLDAVEARLHARAGRVAAVMLQPGGDPKLPAPGFLEGLARLCRAHGALLVFDETRTGLRVARGGAQERFGVTPDLTTVSKGLANGLPLSAVLGRADVLVRVRDAQVGGTYQRDLVAHAAASATLRAAEARGTTARLWSSGERLVAGMRAIAADHPALGIGVSGLAPMPRVKVRPSDLPEEPARDVFHAALFERGVLFPPNHHLFLSDAHGVEEIDLTLSAFEAACRIAGPRFDRLRSQGGRP